MQPINLKEELAKDLLSAGHFVEVTQELFNKLEVSREDLIARLDSELASREFYHVGWTVIQVLHGHLTGTSQYYIQDINA